MLTESLVYQVLCDLLDLDEKDLRPDLRFDEIGGWDSVNALRLLVFLERETGIKIDYSGFMAAECLSDLWNLGERNAAKVA